MPKTDTPSTLVLEATLGTSNVTRLRVGVNKPLSALAPQPLGPEACMDVLYAVIAGTFTPPTTTAEILSFPNRNQRFTA